MVVESAVAAVPAAAPTAADTHDTTEQLGESRAQAAPVLLLHRGLHMAD